MLPVTLRVYLVAGIIVGGVLAAVESVNGKDFRALLYFEIALVMFPVAIHLCMRLLQIEASNRRFAKSQLTRAGYDAKRANEVLLK